MIPQLATVRARIRSIPFESPHYRCGIHAGYADVTPTWGYKLFRSAMERDKNFDLQSRAYLHGLAPNVRDCFAERAYGGISVYGFSTESIPFTEKERFYGFRHVDVFNVKDYNEWRRTHLSIIQDLQYQLEKIGITSRDVSNWDNVGYLRGGMVCIDFSCEELD